jgi:heat shock protein HtpX
VAMRNPAAASLYIVPGGGGDSMFSTHPDTGNRIAALEGIAVEMGVSSASIATRASYSAVPRTRARRSALDPLGRND